VHSSNWIQKNKSEKFSKFNDKAAVFFEKSKKSRTSFRLRESNHREQNTSADFKTLADRQNGFVWQNGDSAVAETAMVDDLTGQVVFRPFFTTS
jgi:hypothetical protein